jgi:predicted O-methyltransferase YrrM
MTIGCVLVSRNDNYGGNLKERATYCINSLINTVDEIVYVDWSSDKNSLVDEIQGDLIYSNKLKWIVISPEEANILLDGKPSQKCVEVLGRNIGIRRLNTDFILSTNIDVICPTRNYFDLLQDKDTFYVGARRNIPLSEVTSQEELMKLNYPQVGDSGAFIGDVWSLVNCCGDFQYAHKDVWYSIRGFEESLIGRGFTDSNVQKKAQLNGFKLKVVRDIPFYHINHEGGFGGSGIINDMDFSLRDFENTTNKEDWGFNNMKLDVHTLVNDFFELKIGTPSDISEHLQFLHDVTVVMNAKQVVELGVREGCSTSAFLSALTETSGNLWSCDIQRPIGEVAKFLDNFNWSFNLGNSISLTTIKVIPNSYDIVFIDTSHFFNETYQEMTLYFQNLRLGGLMILHDSNEPVYATEKDAINRFMDLHTTSEWFEFKNNHGLFVICKGSEFSTKVRDLLK